MKIDPLGLYTGGWHRDFSLSGGTLAGLGPSEAADLAGRVVDVDTEDGSQEMRSSHMHAMCPPRTSRDRCEARYNEYVREQLAKCTLDGLAHAIHAVQDSYSRAHRGFRVYPGMLGLSPMHLLDDAVPGRWERQYVPQITRDLIKQWEQQCSCRR